MRIVSANLNQRLGNSATRRLIESWLSDRQPQILLAQEPFRPDKTEPPCLRGFELVSSTSHVYCWLSNGVPRPEVLCHGVRWVELRWSTLSVHNVYLPDNSSRARRLQLEQMAERLKGAASTCHILLGDFNMAPRLEDGLFGDAVSTFTKRGERAALQSLILSGGLIDTTQPRDEEEVPFTFERVQNARSSRFRCDLALISRQLTGRFHVDYDHSARKGTGRFTDHSAIIVDMPSYPLQSCDQTGRIVVPEHSLAVAAPADRSDYAIAALAASSHKTAIRRQRPSQVARALHDQGVLRDLGVASILDYGCAFGTDVEYYSAKGYLAAGFDPEARFGALDLPDRQFDFVTLVFVVNVLPALNLRKQVVEAAAARVKPGGRLLIAARSEQAVRTAAMKGNWPAKSDGWISDTRKMTFQKGIGLIEIGWLMGTAGLHPSSCNLRLSREVAWGVGLKPHASA